MTSPFVHTGLADVSLVKRGARQLLEVGGDFLPQNHASRRPFEDFDLQAAVLFVPVFEDVSAGQHEAAAIGVEDVYCPGGAPENNPLKPAPKRIEALKPGFLALPAEGRNAVWFASTVTLSALGMYLWPHAFSAVFTARSERTFRKNAVVMPLVGQSWRETLLVYAGIAAIAGIAWVVLAREPRGVHGNRRQRRRGAGACIEREPALAVQHLHGGGQLPPGTALKIPQHPWDSLQRDDCSSACKEAPWKTYTKLNRC